MLFDSLVNLAKDGVSKFRTPTNEMELDFLIDEIRKYNRGADFDLLKRCYEYGKKQHESKKRKSGEPYFVHCVETAKTLIDLKMDIHTIGAGLLHDTIEDTDTLRDDLADLFDSQIADLVEAVTKIGTVHFQGSYEERQVENYRKMLLAMAKDVRVILIKLADRLHNMRTLEWHDDEDKQRYIASETLEIYASLAHRLGMAQIKCELEDLSFKYLDYKEYKKIAGRLNERRTEREEYLVEMAEKICDVVEKKGLDPVVFGRAKNLYSIYQKIHKKGVPFKDICDLIAFRVLVDSAGDCYVAFGALHEKWTHIPERVKDFIGPLAKTNGYQSLHTTILDEGRPVEIQIRTHEMHQVAERGIAAHWRYKEGMPAKSHNQPFVWLRDFVEHIQELNDPEQFLQSIREDLFPDEVYVFTPKGDLVALSAGSTPVDLAYKIHTDLGDTCVGAEVDGRIVPLRYRLRNSDQVKIITDKHANPSRDWLNFVKTGRARNKIRRWLREQERTQSLEIGQQLLEAELRRRHIDPKPQMKSEDLLIIAESIELHSIEDLLVQIGYGDVSAQHVVNLMFPPEKEKEEDYEFPEEEKTERAVSVAGIGHAFVRVSKCCNPIPGDDVIGFLTRGRGVSIHKKICNKIMNEPERIVPVVWDIMEDVTYPVEIWIESNDRKGLLGDISTAIAKEDVNIVKGNFGPRSYTTSYQRMVISVTGVKHLNRVIRVIERVRGVRKVMRKEGTKVKVKG